MRNGTKQAHVAAVGPASRWPGPPGPSRLRTSREKKHALSFSSSFRPYLKENSGPIDPEYQNRTNEPVSVDIFVLEQNN
jgi:hypothetical protein